MKKRLLVLIMAFLYCGCGGLESKVNRSKTFSSKWKIQHTYKDGGKSKGFLSITVTPDGFFGHNLKLIESREGGIPHTVCAESDFLFDGSEIYQFNIKRYWKNTPSKVEEGGQYRYKPDDSFRQFQQFWKLPSGMTWQEKPGGSILEHPTTDLITAVNIGLGMAVKSTYSVDPERGVVVRCKMGVGEDPSTGEMMFGTIFECTEMKINPTATKPEFELPDKSGFTDKEGFVWLTKLMS